jgi:hypothetical protein
MSHEESGPLATMLGTYYPKDYLVAVLPDAGAAERTVAALREAGWGDAEVETWSGDVVIAMQEQRQAHRSLMERLGAALASDERMAVDQYIEEARQGRHFVTVRAPEEAQADRAAEILARHGAYGMRHYGANTLREIAQPVDEQTPPEKM